MDRFFATAPSSAPRSRRAARERRASADFRGRRCAQRGGSARRVPENAWLLRRDRRRARPLYRQVEGHRPAVHRRGSSRAPGSAKGRAATPASTPARGAWVLEIDADERVAPELAAEIRRIAEHSTGILAPDPGRQLYRRAAGALGLGRLVRQVALCRALSQRRQALGRRARASRGDVVRARRGRRSTARLVHHVDRNISDMLARLDRYTSARAKDLRESGDIGSYARNLRRIVTRFWKCYVGRRGYREGPYGLSDRAVRRRSTRSSPISRRGWRRSDGERRDGR